jgi:hypothetical protein
LSLLLREILLVTTVRAVDRGQFGVRAGQGVFGCPTVVPRLAQADGRTAHAKPNAVDEG